MNTIRSNLEVSASPLSSGAPSTVSLAPMLETWFGAPRAAAIQSSLRAPNTIMTPEALSAMKSCALSFSRTLVRRMVDERWQICRRALDIDVQGNGHALYELAANGYVFSLIVRSSWDGKEKTGRRMDPTADFIASLISGVVDEKRIQWELEGMGVPHWGGRTDQRSFGWTGANRSRRFFDLAVEALVAGRQPDIDEMAAGGGYVVRNAGFYGNGRAGAASWLSIGSDHPFSVPYHLDMFLLYMWREISLDFIEAIATKRSPAAVALASQVRSYLGIGNSSGLGMTCALVRWPQWVSVWCLSREVALAFAKTDDPGAVLARIPALRARVVRAIRYYREVPGPEHGLTTHEEIVADLERVRNEIDSMSAKGRKAASWSELCEAVERKVGLDAYEQLNAFLIDLYPECTDKLLQILPAAMRRKRQLVPEMTVGELREILALNYHWALTVDRSDPESLWHFWYNSEEAGEQRRGERLIDPGAEYEIFTDVIGPVQDCYRAIEAFPNETSVARFLLAKPQLAYIVSRVQFLEHDPYGEIRGNLVARSFVPLKAIRFFLSVLGLESGAPRSKGWVRGVFLQGAPSPSEIGLGQMTDWVMPTKPGMTP